MIHQLLHKLTLPLKTPILHRHFIERLASTHTAPKKSSPKPVSFFCKTPRRPSSSHDPLNAPKTPEKLLHLLKDYGFSDPQIAALVARRPKLLRTNTARFVAPKLHFFRSLGFTDAQVVKLLCSWTVVLNSSVKNRYLPNLATLRSVLQDDDAKVRRAFQRFPMILSFDLNVVLMPRIKALQDFGVTDTVMKVFMGTYPQSLIYPLRGFEETFEAIKAMGIDPWKCMFAHAFRMFSIMHERVWERKLEHYRMLGWSREQVMFAFAKHPFCMAVSDEKLRKNVGFFTEKLKWGPEYLSKNPVLLSLSFEKRIQPRYLLLEYLNSKGLLKSKVRARDIQMKDKDFIAKYVVKYQSECPELLHAIGGSKTKLESFSMTSLRVN